jgi:hypothetical protein
LHGINERRRKRESANNCFELRPAEMNASLKSKQHGQDHKKCSDNKTTL